MKDHSRQKTGIARERAALVGVTLPPHESMGTLYDPLAELAALAQSAGADVVDRVFQRRARINAGTYIGKGKLVELAQRVQDKEADVVIFDNDLSPSQIRDIEKVVGRKVLDRTELILDIFASRAKTTAARLQVELAQLQYTAPRLRGMWTHLERIAGAGGGTAVGSVGGIGTRGPGERQIEIDRRIAQKRMSFLRDQIKRIDARKLREVRSRRDYFTVSIVGYTNAGKSTLMNALTAGGAYVADKLFATLDTRTRRWELGGGQTALLSDTVGFVRDLPHQLVASFRATLEETIHADLLLHVVDASSPLAARQIQAVDEVLKELGCDKAPTLLVFNKIDAVEDVADLSVLRKDHVSAVEISARSGLGIPELAARVVEAMRGRYVRVSLEASAGDGKLLAYVRQYGHVLDTQYEDGQVRLTLRIPAGELPRLDRLGATVLSDPP